MLVQREGVWWPKTERGLQGDLQSLDDVEDHILPHCKQRRYAVQAGGAVGLWPKKLAEYFEEVFTFEPNAVLYECLLRNTADTENVNAANIALWEESTTCEMVKPKDWNMGGWHIAPGGATPAAALDEFELDFVDLIMLDIEGAEDAALYGAERTIERCKPVIVVETKEACMANFGYTKRDLHEHLYALGYRFRTGFHGGRDELWLPN